MGRKGPAMTLKYYSHWIPTGDKRFVDGRDRDSGINLEKPLVIPRESADIGLNGPLWNRPNYNDPQRTRRQENRKKSMKTFILVIPGYVGSGTRSGPLVDIGK
jgi:hypothetical protein